MKYGYACVNPSFFMEFQQNLPQQKELLRAGVKKEHMIIEASCCAVWKPEMSWFVIHNVTWEKQLMNAGIAWMVSLTAG